MMQIYRITSIAKLIILLYIYNFLCVGILRHESYKNDFPVYLIFDFQTNLEVFDQARIQQAKISFDFLAPILKSNSQ